MKRTSIRYRLTILMICLTALPVLTVTWIATMNTRTSLEKEIIEANRSRMMWADQYLDELIRQVDVLFYSLQINQELMDGVSTIGNQPSGLQYRTQKHIQDTLTSAYYANSKKIDELSLYTHLNQTVYSVNYVNSGLIYTLDIETGNWSRMLKGPERMYFKQSGSGIYAYHSVNRFEDRELLGGLAVRINKDVWEEVSRIIKSEEESSVFLINDEGEHLSGSTSGEEREELLKFLDEERTLGLDVEIHKTSNYYIFLKKVDNGELTLVKALPMTAITESTGKTVRAGIVTGMLFGAVSLLLAIAISLRISRPIVRLARTMRTAPIHQFELTSVQSKDELGLLERGYNSMMERIKELIENEYQKEIEVKNAQLLALQAQINPHFLNNTLNLIGGMALSKGAPEIYKVTKGIGDLLRYSISSGNVTATLLDELKHVRNYLFIQEQRYLGRCSIQIFHDGSGERLRLPKFTLQPVVENAFEHGLQPKEGSWQVEIRVKTVRERLLIMIKDDGVGMSKESLQAIRKELNEGSTSMTERPSSDSGVPKKQKGIGLQNVASRLKLQFGAGAAVRIYSREGNGTVVVLKVPIPSRGQQDEPSDNH